MIDDGEGNLIPDPDDVEPDSENEEPPAPGEEKKEKNYDNYEPNKNIVPACFLWVDGEDDVLKLRVKGLPQDQVAGTHWATEPEMDRRLKAYKEHNKSDVGNPNLANFFEKYNISVFSQHCNEPEEKVFEAFKIFVEKDGKPFNYMTYDEENEKKWLEEKQHLTSL
jgi:L-rhamnose mutarotase